MTTRRSEKRCLWKPQQFENSTEEDSTSYGDVFRAYSSKPKPKSFFRLCANSLIVVQELALSSYFLARHRMAVLPATPTSDLHLNYSNAAIISALFLAIFYGMRSDPSKQQNRRVKAKQRGFDFLLLAVLLRFLASVLRTLTASYSSDTVQSLAWGGMVLHVAACDYNYANGIGSDVILQQQQRPPFSGGTVALNAALFSTTLLNSRLSSNSGAYLFSSLAVVLFAFYSSTRHAIAASYPPADSEALWIITALVILATVLLVLDEWSLVRLFLVMVCVLGLVLPAWKYHFQQSKLLVRGPWDIPTAPTMRLNFRSEEKIKAM